MEDLSIKEKYHFFIGNIFTSEDQLIALKNIQKKLKKKYLLKDSHYNNKLCTNLIYLGYLDNETANNYMNNIICKLLTAISNKFSTLKCKYTGYKIDYDKSYYKISLQFDDENNYLKQIIVPYLYENGILPIYDKKKYIHDPSIDLIYYKKSSILESKKNGVTIQLPQNEFDINYLSLIKGTPTNIRSGTPSVHDQMYFEEIYQYKFPLKSNNIF